VGCFFCFYFQSDENGDQDELLGFVRQDSEAYHTGGIVESAGGITQRYSGNMGLSRYPGPAQASTIAQPIAGLLSHQRAGYLDL